MNFIQKLATGEAEFDDKDEVSHGYVTRGVLIMWVWSAGGAEGGRVGGAVSGGPD